MYGNCGNWQPSSAKNPSICPATACTLSWPPVMMKPATLLLQQVPVGDGLLVLDAVHALDHLVVEAARAAPADRRGDQDHVGPVHDALVDLVQLVVRVHLRDRARPGAGARATSNRSPRSARKLRSRNADQLRLAAVARGALRERVHRAGPRRCCSAGAPRSSPWSRCPSTRIGPGSRCRRRAPAGAARAACGRACVGGAGVDQHAAALDLAPRTPARVSSS